MTWWDEIEKKPAGADVSAGFWDDLERRIDYLDVVPRKSDTAECIEVREQQTGVHFVLRDPERSTYIRLVPEEYRIWELIDGTHRIRDIVHGYLSRGGWFSFERVSRFFDELERNGMLEGSHADVYGELAALVERRRFGPLFAGLARLGDMSAIDIPWLDPVTRRLAAWSDLVPRARWILLTMAGLITGSGGWIFLWTLRTGQFSPFRIGDSYGWGLITLVLAYLIAVNTGQLARAVGAHILGFGVDLSQFRVGRRGLEIVPFGSDFVLATIRERTLMNFGRMFALLVLGGTGGAVSYFWRANGSLGEIGFVAGCAAYAALFMEIMPFGQSAAYRLFSDWSGIPALRSRAARYALREMAPRVLGRHAFNRNDKIMLFYCGWCVLWLAALARVCVRLVDTEAPMLIQQVFSERTTVAGVIAMAILAILAFATILYAVGVTGFVLVGLGRYLLREGLLRRAGARAAISAVGWTAASLALLILARGQSHMAAFTCACIAVVAVVSGSRLVRWRRDISCARYHYITAVVVVFALTLVMLGILHMDSAKYAPLTVIELSDFAVTAAFVLLVVFELFMLRPVSFRSMGPIRLAVVAVVIVTACSSFTAGRSINTADELLAALPYIAAGLLAALPVWPVAAAFGSATLPVWLLVWSAIMIFTSGFTALWGRGVDIPYPVLALTIGLMASWFDCERSALRGIMRERDMPRVPSEEETRSPVETAIDGLLAWYGKFCGTPFADTVRLRIARHSGEDALIAAASSMARHSGPRFAVAALGRVMASLSWDDREEVDDILAAGPGWMAPARLPTRVSRDVRVALLRDIPQAANLTPEAVEQLADQAHLRRFRPGETIFDQGEPAHTLYVVVTGSLDLLVEKSDGRRHAVARFVPGDHFGGVSMLLAGERSASARAVSTTVCLELDTAMLAACTGRENGIQWLHNAQIDLVERCRKMSLFAGFTTAMLRHFLSQCRHIEYPADSLIVETDTASEQFSVILSGRCRRGGEAGPKMLAGDCFGQETLLIGDTLPEITAIDETELLVMAGRDFMSIMGVADAAPQGFVERVRRRMRSERVAAAMPREDTE